MKKWQKLHCRSSRTQATKWKRVSLTSNRTFLFPHFIYIIKIKQNPGSPTRASFISVKCVQAVILFFVTSSSSLPDSNGVLLLLLLVFYCRYCKPKLREAPLDRPSMRSTASMRCSPTGTHTLPKSLRSVGASPLFHET